MRRTVASPHAPKAIGPYSQAVITRHADDIQMLHAAGQIPIDPATGELVAGDIVATHEVLPGSHCVSRQKEHFEGLLKQKLDAHKRTHERG